jgi:hypothetical protein
MPCQPQTHAKHVDVCWGPRAMTRAQSFAFTDSTSGHHASDSVIRDWVEPDSLWNIPHSLLFSVKGLQDMTLSLPHWDELSIYRCMHAARRPPSWHDAFEHQAVAHPGARSFHSYRFGQDKKSSTSSSGSGSSRSCLVTLFHNYSTDDPCCCTPPAKVDLHPAEDRAPERHGKNGASTCFCMALGPSSS